MERLGWEAQPGETELERQLRGDLLRTVGTLGDDPATQERARALYARYREDESAVDPNVLPALIAIVAAAGGETEYDEFLQRFKAARSPQEEQRYLYALAAFRAPELDPSHPREDHQRRGAQPGRAVPDAGAPGRRAQPRPRLGLRQGDAGRRWPGSIRAAPTAGCTKG